MIKNITLGLAALLLVGSFGAGCTQPSTDTTDTAKNTQDQATQPSVNDTVATVDEAGGEQAMDNANYYTMADIAQHATKEDCWFVIHEIVYDVTEYAKHPGGEAILEGCGKDATELFETRPMGSGTPHSDKARGYMKNYEIGFLSEASAMVTDE